MPLAHLGMSWHMEASIWLGTMSAALETLDKCAKLAIFVKMHLHCRSELLALGDEGGSGEVAFVWPLEKVVISVI
jgi:hypothetical protein